MEGFGTLEPKLVPEGLFNKATKETLHRAADRLGQSTNRTHH